MFRTAPLFPALLFALPAWADGSVHVHDGWVASTEAPEARLFLEIENEGSGPVDIVGFATDRGTAELAAPALDGGREVVALGVYPLDPGQALEMAPDAVHVRLTGLDAPLVEGERFEIRVMVEPGEEVVANVLVEGPDAESEDHSGHDH